MKILIKLLIASGSILVLFLTIWIYLLLSHAEEVRYENHKEIFDNLIGRWVANQVYNLDGERIVFKYEIVIVDINKIVFQRPFVRTYWNPDANPKTVISKPMNFTYRLEGTNLERFKIFFKEADGFGFRANINNETLTLTNPSLYPQQLILKKAPIE